MRFPGFIRWFLGLFLGFLVIDTSVQAAQQDVRVLIDVSGSMKQNDPNNLRKPALRMLNSLIPSGANAGVWTFGRYVTMEVKWGKVDNAWRQRADKGVEAINSLSQFTHIESAIERATQGWDQPDPKTSRSLILLTDGEVDISKNPEDSQSSRQRILEEQIPRLKKNDIKVYSIALSRHSDEELLKKLALESNGAFELALDAGELQKIFFRMFAKATQPDTLPLQGNSFEVDDQVKEMTLMIFRKDPDKAARLLDPKAQTHTGQQHANNQKWRSESSYDLVTVTKPMPGKWQIEADMDPENRVMILTDLTLHTATIPGYLKPGESLKIEMELQSKGQRIRKNSFLKFVEFKLEHEQGLVEPETLSLTTDDLDYARKGIYSATLENLQNEGEHTLILHADGTTFKREKRVQFKVEAPLQWLSEELAPGRYRLSIVPREEYIMLDSLVANAWYTRPDGVKKALEWRQSESALMAELVADQAGEYRIQADVQATANDGDILSLRLAPMTLLGVLPAAEDQASAAMATDAEAQTGLTAETETEQQEQGANWLVVGLSAALMSLMIVISGGLLWRRLNRRETTHEYFSDNSEALPA